MSLRKFGPIPAGPAVLPRSSQRLQPFDTCRSIRSSPVLPAPSVHRFMPVHPFCPGHTDTPSIPVTPNLLSTRQHRSTGLPGTTSAHLVLPNFSSGRPLPLSCHRTGNSLLPFPSGLRRPARLFHVSVPSTSDFLALASLRRSDCHLPESVPATHGSHSLPTSCCLSAHCLIRFRLPTVGNLASLWLCVSSISERFLASTGNHFWPVSG
jgi:hypothetical protein